MDNVKQAIVAILDLLIGLRKFIVMLALVVSGIAFLINGKLTGREFVDLLQGTAVAFFAANGAEQISDVVKEWLKGKQA